MLAIFGRIGESDSKREVQRLIQLHDAAFGPGPVERRIVTQRRSCGGHCGGRTADAAQVALALRSLRAASPRHPLGATGLLSGIPGAHGVRRVSLPRRRDWGRAADYSATSRALSRSDTTMSYSLTVICTTPERKPAAFAWT